MTTGLGLDRDSLNWQMGDPLPLGITPWHFTSTLLIYSILNNAWSFWDQLGNEWMDGTAPLVFAAAVTETYTYKLEFVLWEIICSLASAGCSPCSASMTPYAWSFPPTPGHLLPRSISSTSNLLANSKFLLSTRCWHSRPPVLLLLVNLDCDTGVLLWTPKMTRFSIMATLRPRLKNLVASSWWGRRTSACLFQATTV